MSEIDWVAVGNSVKTWTVSFCVFSISFVTLGLIRQTILRKFAHRLDAEGAHSKLHFKTHFNRHLNKQIYTQVKGDLKIDPKLQVNELLISLLKRTKLAFIFFWALFAGMAFHNTPDHIDQFARKFIFFVSMVQIGFWCGALITFWIEHTVKLKLEKDLASASTMGLVSFLAKFGLYGLLCLITLNNFGVDITALVAGLGVGGIAVALAVQNILGDLFASLTIVLDKPFVVGDLIIAETLTGYVERIGLKTTRIRSISGEQLIFPNGDLLKSRIRNFKRMDQRRVLFTLHIEHGTSHEVLSQISSLFKAVIESQKKTRFDRANLKTLGLFSFEFEVVYWVKDRDMNVYMAVHEAVILAIYQRLQKEGIVLARFSHPLYSAWGSPPVVPESLLVSQSTPQ